jgi:hypothetical protein
MILSRSQSPSIIGWFHDYSGYRARDGRVRRPTSGDLRERRTLKRRDRRAGKREIVTQLCDHADEVDFINAELAALYAEALVWQAQYEEEYLRMIGDDWWQ